MEIDSVINKIVKKFKNQAGTAAAAGVGQSSVAMWKRRGNIPYPRQVKLLKAAKEMGIKLKAADFFEEFEE